MELSMVLDLSPDFIQGYYYGKPCSYEEFLDKDARPKDEAYRMILDGECGTFSPKIIECSLTTQALNNEYEFKLLSLMSGMIHSYDALVSVRVYKDARPKDEAYRMI